LHHEYCFGGEIKQNKTKTGAREAIKWKFRNNFAFLPGIKTLVF